MFFFFLSLSFIFRLSGVFFFFSFTFRICHFLWIFGISFFIYFYFILAWVTRNRGHSFFLFPSFSYIILHHRYLGRVFGDSIVRRMYFLVFVSFSPHLPPPLPLRLVSTERQDKMAAVLGVFFFTIFFFLICGYNTWGSVISRPDGMGWEVGSWRDIWLGEGEGNIAEGPGYWDLGDRYLPAQYY